MKRRKKPFEELTMKDDFMFGKVMSNQTLCKAVLETLLNIKIDAINYPYEQKSVEITTQGRGVRMDVYVEDEEGTVYDAEMQQKSNNNYVNEELPQRSRYYQGMIDLNILKKRARFIDLKKTYIIFICTFDPFGANRCCYTFENMCREDSTLKLQDGAVKIFFNTEGTIQTIPKETRELLNYIKSGTTKTTLTKQLETEVQRIKKNEEWRVEYMKTLLYEDEIREEGREEGLEQGLEEGMNIMIETGIEYGMPREVIVGNLKKRFHLSEEAANRWYEKTAAHKEV